jgi:hypothetical protein
MTDRASIVTSIVLDVIATKLREQPRSLHRADADIKRELEAARAYVAACLHDEFEAVAAEVYSEALIEAQRR